MNRPNLFFKQFKKRILSTNSLIEGYFNKFKSIKSSLKKGDFIKNNKVFFSLAAVVILTIGYFLSPTLHNKDILQSKIKNHILKKYNIDIKFNEKLKYGLIPKPHFYSTDVSILREKKEIGKVKFFDFYIDSGTLFSIDKIKIKNLLINEADFNITKDDLVFFEDLLKTEPNENKIYLKKSNIFFKSKNDETLFLNKIYKSQFYYDSINLENVFRSSNEIFNIPYKLMIKNNKFNKDLFISFNSRKIRLNVENNTKYEDEIKKGKLDFLFVNNSKTLIYEIKKNSLEFLTEDKKTLMGSLEFKPFYLKADLDYEGVSTKELFKKDSILVDLIKSEILHNENLNVNINLNVKDVINFNELNNLLLKLGLVQGDITLTNSKIMWKDDLEILMKDGVLSYDNSEIFLIGRIFINANDINDFYKSFQVKKINRKPIKNIEFDFVYNFNQNRFQFDNILVNNKTNSDIDNYIDNYNSTGKIFSNKITFKNFINNFFEIYSG